MIARRFRLPRRLLPQRAAAVRTKVSFALTPEQDALKQRVRAFVRSKVIPLEKARSDQRTPHGFSEALRDELVALAHADGLSPRTPAFRAALESHVTRAVVFEAAGYSLLGT